MHFRLDRCPGTVFVIKSAAAVFILVTALATAWALPFKHLSNRIVCHLQPPPGYPMPDGAVVDLNLTSGGRIGTGDASGNGSFTFNELPPGQYTISVKAEGYEPIERDIEVPSGYLHNVVNVTLNLTPRPQASGAPPSKEERTVGIKSLRIPADALDELKAAEKAAADKSFDQAIQHAEKALELYPDYFEAYNNLAVYQSKVGQNEKAVSLFQRALTLEPDAVGASLNLGRVLIGLKRPQEAALYLQHAADVDRTSSEIQYHLARALILCLRLPDSIPRLRMALKLQPPVNHARYLLANVLYQLGDVSEAIQEMEAYLKTKPPEGSELKQQLRAWKKLAASAGK
jgi:Tfp pilus assembly protein PilF